MNDEKLLEIQQSLFFELGHKIDLYHFTNLREIAIVEHGKPFTVENVIKSYKY